MSSSRTLGAAAVALALSMTAASGCERFNPGWCEEHAACGVNEFCDPATNTCRSRDAGQPDFDHGPPDQAPDRRHDQAQDRPVDQPTDRPPDKKTLPDIKPPPDKTPVIDVSPETSPQEGGAG